MRDFADRLGRRSSMNSSFLYHALVLRDFKPQSYDIYMHMHLRPCYSLWASIWACIQLASPQRHAPQMHDTKASLDIGKPHRDVARLGDISDPGKRRIL